MFTKCSFIQAVKATMGGRADALKVIVCAG